MSNRFSKVSDDSLSQTAIRAAETLQASPDYPLDPARVEALAAAAMDYRAGLIAAQRAYADAMAATAIKDASREALVRALGDVAYDLYRNDSVTDGLLLGIGFAPRPSRNSRPKDARRVTGLRATPAVDGSVRLAWSRSGNSDTTVFTVLASAEGERWRMVGSTVRTSLTLEGFAPGVAASLCVVASNSTGKAPPSSTVSIYLGVAAEAARRAA